MTRGESAKHH